MRRNDIEQSVVQVVDEEGKDWIVDLEEKNLYVSDASRAQRAL